MSNVIILLSNRPLRPQKALFQAIFREALCLRATPSILKKGKVMYPLPPSFPSFRNRLFRLSAVLFFTSDTGREVGQIGPFFPSPCPFFPLIFHLCCPHFGPHFPFRPSRFLSPSPSPVFPLLLHGHEGGEWAGWQSSSCIHSLFRPSYPPFSSPTYPCFPAFPVLPCLYLLSSQKLSQKLVRFPKNLSVIPEKWLIYWLPKNLPFSQKLDDFPKNFPRFYFLGSFQGETRGIGGVVAAVPSVLSKQCLSSLLVSF